MSQAALASIKSAGLALLAALALSTIAVENAMAEPCAEACRAQHNACRMAAKLLFSARCDAQLQGCIGQCFAAARRGLREGRDLRDLRDPREFRDRGPPDMRGPPDRGPPGPPGPLVGRPPLDRGPPDMRGPPLRDFRDFRDERGPRWLGGRGLWDRR